MLQCSPEGGFREWENTLGGGVLRRVVLGDGRTPLWTAVVSRTLFWKIFEKIESFCEHFAPQNATNNTENKSIKIALRGAKNDPQGSKMEPKGSKMEPLRVPGGSLLDTLGTLGGSLGTLGSSLGGPCGPGWVF